MTGGPVTLQINVAPADLAHAATILPHQLRALGDQVDEILFTFDAVTPAGGRFAEGWEANAAPMRTLLEQLCAERDDARVGAVDDGDEAMRAVAARFTGAATIPAKDSRGGPLYAYLFGLHDARHDLVLHLDSDMLLGGGSPTWVAEAAAVLAAEPDALVVGPHPGPPRADGRLLGQPLAQPFEHATPAYAFPSMSTRAFLIDRRRYDARIGPVPLRPPLRLRSRVKARLRGHPQAIMPEQQLTAEMRAHDLLRVDLLGSGDGMWSLHPPLRSPEFYAALADLVDRVERGHVPDAQRGDYDVNDSMIDWASARRLARRGRLLGR